MRNDYCETLEARQVTSDKRWMYHALALAIRAQERGDVPVGAVVVDNDEMISEGWNQSIAQNDPTAHAEIQALRGASLAISNYRLPGKTLFVTLEPCIMCAGAIIHARINRVVFGAHDPKTGAAGSIINIFQNTQINHHTQVSGSVLESECASMLQKFFRDRR